MSWTLIAVLLLLLSVLWIGSRFIAPAERRLLVSPLFYLGMGLAGVGYSTFWLAPGWWRAVGIVPLGLGVWAYDRALRRAGAADPLAQNTLGILLQSLRTTPALKEAPLEELERMRTRVTKMNAVPTEREDVLRLISAEIEYRALQLPGRPPGTT